ncbi:hypothetical protein KFK09_005532 [Dendrobium nobile]|uniref:Ty3-gypsy retrotransposon protein n=1 Tax=Dendrobium nobile TaxID=94219 RepID=A0A8T3BYJ6_DENNO|nr:hypothetical protein KFK09_005532 [Dendrobium nobile]
MMPSDLGEAMKLAQLVKNQKNLEKGVRSSSSRGSYKTTPTLLAPKGPASGNINETTREKPVGRGSEENFKRLTEKEMQEKRAKGLCFRCEEKYTLGHRCKDQTFQALTICNDEEAEGGEEETEEEMEEKLHLDLAEVFPNSVVGFTMNHTMKVKGELEGKEVVVLIDSGATHNFISTQVVDQLGVKLVDTGCYGVMMGTGKVEKGQGIYR